MAKQLGHGRLGRLIGASALLLTVGACRQDMHDQPKYRGLRGSDFFANGQSARPLIANTVARGHLNEDRLLMTGKDGANLTTVFPFPVTEQVMARVKWSVRHPVEASPSTLFLGRGKPGTMLRVVICKAPKAAA